MSAVLGSAVMTDKYLAACSVSDVAVLKVQPVEQVGTVHGGPFRLAAATHGLLFTVVNGETAPFVPTFVLVYQVPSGVFRKSLEFESEILSLAASETHLFVSLAGSIHVLDYESLECIGTIERRSRLGLIGVSEKVMAYPCDGRPGLVTVVSVPGFSVLKELSCHKESIRALSVSRDGRTLTTASDKGTLIRVFDIERGTKISEFRRGFRGSTVIAVDSGSGMTCASTVTSLHVFPSALAHIVVPLSCAPLDIVALEGAVAVVSVDGILSIYQVDGLSCKATLLTQHKVLALSMTDQTKRIKRRTTF